MTRLPPPRPVRAATELRTALQSLTPRMDPPQVGLLELASGFVATHAIDGAGLRMARVIPTSSTIALIEAAPGSAR